MLDRPHTREDPFEMSANILLWQGGLLGVGAKFPKSQRGWILRAVVSLLEHASGPRKIFVPFEASLLEGVYSMGLVVCTLEIV